ncbi:IclR family transcriptional regulator [Cupriavidus basilensis OR16]|uniref:IclR family transcriptional regulator n=1 Tax=Cupriavidus basilensis OR16 TaxID=1127483 RepID=H1RYQ3_9BURK|nr:IclR family transcriptional regulator [Cupriavidus basilensis OR16]
MNVKTALRVLEIIETFARERRALSLSELARLLAVPASSCLALIRTLTSLGYLYETGRRQGYYPTGRLLAMAQQIARHDPVLDRVHGTMNELRAATGETVVIGKLHEGRWVVYLDVLESPHAIRYIATAGERRELHANSIGKALLSVRRVSRPSSGQPAPRSSATSAAGSRNSRQPVRESTNPLSASRRQLPARASGTPHSRSRSRSSLMTGNTSWFQSAPCLSCAACSLSTIQRSSLKIRSVNHTSSGHARSRMPGMPGFLIDSSPNVRLVRCSASSGT